MIITKEKIELTKESMFINRSRSSILSDDYFSNFGMLILAESVRRRTLVSFFRNEKVKCFFTIPDFVSVEEMAIVEDEDETFTETKVFIDLFVEEKLICTENPSPCKEENK
jgi:hypothetical protein